ncbi:hypothetical protein B0G75_1122 [Paraburkholderia sp. BL18I3N2]|uniref:hypothetical protein n=1 Tax=Paraburkholderia sp. BL18I3N2 TaxID=1938799 RepID=UPI000D071D4C|nr:hypothetical protein [Paraburkholderia sp. BL18I3N2]PRX28060.1 hypothetical protein B0G75_1122 [Paraburkholderia sp. BL18I3N2]
MKSIFAMLTLAAMFAPSVGAAESSIDIGQIPMVSDASSALKRSLSAIRKNVESDAQICIANAKGSESSGNYIAAIRKVIDSKKVVVMEVTGYMMCDGVHPTSYQYAIALERATGKRLDLNKIYNIAIRSDGRLFIRPELANAVEASYQQKNAGMQSCLNNSDLKQDIKTFPLTFSPAPDGSISLYYEIPSVSAGCFPPLHLSRSAIASYRNVELGSRYDLP